jgi:hypothetical protein
VFASIGRTNYVITGTVNCIVAYQKCFVNLWKEKSFSKDIKGQTVRHRRTNPRFSAAKKPKKAPLPRERCSGLFVDIQDAEGVGAAVTRNGAAGTRNQDFFKRGVFLDQFFY